ncbi:MAG TPA: protein kinase [Gemmataceae bacterium]|nr:protein kinase [Gemmataceae bacterium]
MSLPSCPDPTQLRKLLDGNLAPEEQAVLSQHVDACPRCQAALEQMSAGRESWNDIARQLAEPQEAAEPGLVNAINQLEAEADRSETTAEPAAHADAKLEFLDPPQKPGEIGRFGDYEILELVGRGGMGIVLKAFDPELRRIVAIKVMSPLLANTATARARFRREAQAAAAVTHDHIVTIHAVKEAKGLPYLVMQYIAGRSLQQRIDDCGAMELKEILRIGMQAASGLAAAHAQGLVHRDIKPANILLENGIERVKITDFGLARATDDARVTQSGIVTGTPQYMSPEQASGKSVDHRADLFSLGGVLYAMCTGYAPFRASSSMAVLKKVCDETPRPVQQLNSEIPDWLVAIVEKLMAKNPNDRFQSAQEVASLLGQHLAHMQQPAVFPEPPGVARPVPKKKRRSAPWAIIVVVGLVLMAACAAPLLLIMAFFGYNTVQGPSGGSVSSAQGSESHAEAAVPPGWPGTWKETRASKAPARTGLTAKTMVAPNKDTVLPPVPGFIEKAPEPSRVVYPSQETVLKKFDPKTDEPLTKEIEDRHVSVADGGWQIYAARAPFFGGKASDVLLFELPKQKVGNSTVLLRFKMKSEQILIHAHVGLTVNGSTTWLTPLVSGTTAWRQYEIRSEHASPDPADIQVRVNIDGTGSEWLKDVEVATIRNPPAKAPPEANSTQAPAAQTTEPAKQTIVKKFDPKSDKPLTTAAFNRKVTEKDGGWQIEETLIWQATDIQKVQRLELFELRRPAVAGRKVTLRAQVKTEQSGHAIEFTAMAALELEAGPVGAVAKIGPVRRGATNGQEYEVSIDWLRTTDPETLKINALIENGATMLIKDVEIVTTPLREVPAPVTREATNETVLFRFTPDQKPITTELGFIIVKAEKDGWLLSNGMPGSIDDNLGPRVHLFDLAKPDVAGHRVTIRCKIRSEKVTWARLYLRDESDISQLAAGRKVEGTTNWTEYEFSEDCPLNFHPERLGVDAGLSTGSVWIKDLQIVKSPSAEFLELQRLQGSWQAVEGTDDGKPLTEEQLKGWKISVTDRGFALEKAGGISKGEISWLKLNSVPHECSILPTKRGGNLFLLYDLEGDTWKVCGTIPGIIVPSFDAPAGSKRWLVTFKRSPASKPAGKETLLKKFDPKTDKPISKQVGNRKVTVDGEEWKIELLGEQELGRLDDVTQVHLFEVPGPANEPSRITLRFKVRTEEIGDARFDVHLRYLNLDDLVFKGRKFEGSTNWSSYEISWDASKLQTPDAVALDLLMRAKDATTIATIWLKDVELVKTPLPGEKKPQ